MSFVGDIEEKPVHFQSLLGISCSLSTRSCDPVCEIVTILSNLESNPGLPRCADHPVGVRPILDSPRRGASQPHQPGQMRAESAISGRGRMVTSRRALI